MSFNIKCDTIEIRVDKRTELLGIIQILSDYKKKKPELLEPHGNGYNEKIEKRFSNFKNHEVIKIYNEILNNLNFLYDAPINLFMQLNEDFSYTRLLDYPYKTRLNEDSRITKLLNLLPDFAKEINFEEYYEEYKEKYKIFTNNIKTQLLENDLTEFINKYYNISFDKKFVINLLPFQTWGNFGTRTEEEIHSNISSLTIIDSEANMFEKDKEIYNYLYLIFHEFSHSYINPLTGKHFTLEDPELFSEIYDDMKQQAYTTNATIINEHVIRALTIRYLWFIEKDKEFYKSEINIEKNNSFIYIENIISSLIEYENNRDKYKNLDKFYPILLKNLIKEVKHPQEKKK